MRAYRARLRQRLSELAPTTDADGVRIVTIEPGSALEGAPVRSALVHGVLLTAIERGASTLEPAGTTILAAGDRITALGASDALQRLADEARAPAPPA